MKQNKLQIKKSKILEQAATKLLKRAELGERLKQLDKKSKKDLENL